MGKKTYYPFPNFRVNYRYRGVIPALLKTVKQEVVSETSAHTTLPIYGKSSCVLTYNNQHLSIQVSRDNFKIKLDEIYFSYAFLNGQPYQTYTDKKGFGAYMSQLNFATHCASTACGISSEHLLAEDAMIRSIYRFHVVFQTRKILNT